MNNNQITNYNGRDIKIGSIAENNEIIKDHMLAHFNLNETETDNWFLRFNSQVKEMNNFIKLTSDKKVLFDIGSQFGSFSFPFLGNSDDKRVFAFDGGINPFLTTSQIKIINNLNNFNVFNFLIGNQDEIVKCFSESLQSLALPGNDTRLMFRIDTLCSIFDTYPDVIKIDIEGCEYQALLGSIDTITNYQPMIFIEVHPKFLTQYQNNINDIVEFVKMINYDVYDLNQNKVENYLEVLQQEQTDSNRTVWVPKNIKYA
jgi:FkbM family methyltransferase